MKKVKVKETPKFTKYHAEKEIKYFFDELYSQNALY